MIQNFFLTLPPVPKGFHLITDHVLKAIGPLPEKGIVHIFIQHTSAGLAITENADPSVRHDLDKSFDLLAPENQPFYKHTDEGPDDMPAHTKAILSGSSLSIPIDKGRLALGTWQGITLCEFRKNASGRKIVVTLLT